MKTLKNLLAITIALTMVGTVSAQTHIYVTGSTAFRSSAVGAINTLVGKTPDAWDGNSSGVTTSTNANAQIWNTATYIVKASWSGSTGGIQTVAGAPNFNVRFLANIGTNGVVAGSNNSDPRGSSSTNAEAHVPDMNFADTFQGGTPFNGKVNGVTYANETDNSIGIVTFRWTASENFPGTNMTPQLAQYLYTNVGVAPLSLWTGNSVDAAKVVYAGGRDPDSGTRATTYAESGIGIFTGVQQWQPINISSGVIGDIQLYPPETVNGISLPQGQGGESSGSSLRAFLTNTLSATAAGEYNGATTAYLMAYLGVSDSNGVISGQVAPNGNAVGLTWNGVAFSQTAVEQGQYTFWGYEHLDYVGNLDGNSGTGGKLAFATNLKNGVAGSSSATLNPNVALGDMQVQRFSDGGNVQPIGF
jgi:hypothetical protein